MIELSRQYGFTLRPTRASASLSNPYAERANRTIQTIARTLHIAAGLPNDLAEEAVQAASFIYNYTPSSHHPDTLPINRLTNARHSNAFLRSYGCHAWIHIPNAKARQGYFGPRAVFGVLCGYDTTGRYRLYIPQLNCVVASTSVRFNEQRVGLRIPHLMAQPILHTYDPNITPQERQNILHAINSPSTSPSAPPLQDTPLPLTQPADPTAVLPIPPPSMATPAPTTPITAPRPSVSPSPSTLDPVHLRQQFPNVIPTMLNMHLLHPSLITTDTLSTYNQLSAQKQSDTLTHLFNHNQWFNYQLRYLGWQPNNHPQHLRHHPTPRRTLSVTADTPTLSADSPAHPPSYDDVTIAPQHIDTYDTALFSLLTEPVPLKYANAIEDPTWKPAIHAELENFKKLQTFSLEQVPPRAKVIKGKWIFTIKTDPNSGASKHKARYVAQGFLQRPGLDYSDTYAPTVGKEIFKLLLAVAASTGRKLYKYDITNAFLNASLEYNVPIYVQPADPNHPPNYAWKMHKAIYGLKQAGNAWNATLHALLTKLNYHNVDNEKCLYFNPQDHTYLVTHVDDIAILADEATAKLFATHLGAHLPVKFEGLLTSFCGFQVEYQDQGITVHQTAYLHSILTKYGYDNANPVATPIQTRPPATSSKAPLLQKFALNMIVGSLLYLAICTRPDIIYAVTRLAAHVQKPSDLAYSMAARILRYLRGHNHGLFFAAHHAHPTQPLISYTDANWTNQAIPDPDNTASSHGCRLHFLQSDSGIITSPFHHISHRIRTICLSSTESELYELVETAKDAIAFRHIVQQSGLLQIQDPHIIFEDNDAARLLATNNVFTRKTRHLDTRLAIINDWHHQHLITTNRVQSAYNLADIGTKALPRDTFERLRDRILRKLP